MSNNNSMIDDLFDSETMKKYPEAYALTINETRLLMRAEIAFFGVANKFQGVINDEMQDPDLRNQIGEQIEAAAFAAFRKKRINPDLIIKIADRIERGKYWSYDRINMTTYKTNSNIPGIVEQFGTTLEAFFATDNPRERARLLEVPEDGLFIPSYELFTLQRLRDFCKGHEEEQSTSKEWTIKSSPVLSVLNDIGRKSIIEKVFVGDDFGDELDGKYVITATGKEKVQISIEASQWSKTMERLLLAPSVSKLLTQANHKALEQKLTSQTVILTLDEFMEARGLKDRKEAAGAMAKATYALGAIYVCLEDGTGSFKGRHIAEEADYITRKGIKPYSRITYSSAYFSVLDQVEQYMQYPTKLQLIPNNHPTAYSIVSAFLEHRRRNITKGEEAGNKLYVSTLLERTPIPPYESLKDKGQAAQRIITPFIKELDYLEEEGYLTYQFEYKKNGSNTVELTDADTYNLYSDYKLFSSLAVRVTIYDEPDYSHLLERKQAQKERAKKNKGRGNKPVKK